MYHVTNGLRRHCAPAPAAVLLLALCLFLVGTGQAVAGPMETTALADANATYAQTAALAPYPGTHDVPGLVQAKDFDVGGEGVAYHDTEPANLGGAYRPTEGVDIETTGLFTDVGWIRSGEWLTYTVNATEPQDVRTSGSGPRTRTRPRSGSPSLPTAFLPGRSIFDRPGRSTCMQTAIRHPSRSPRGRPRSGSRSTGSQRVNLLDFDFQLANPPEPTPVPTPEPELLVDTPGLHTLDRDLTADRIGDPDHRI